MYTIGLCLKILIREGLFNGKKEKLGSKQAVKFSKAPKKIREGEGPSRGVIQKCEPHERSPCAPKFEERLQEETLHQERCARRVAWDLAKRTYKLKNADKTTFLLSYRSQGGAARPLRKVQKNEDSRLIRELQCPATERSDKPAAGQLERDKTQ